MNRMNIEEHLKAISQSAGNSQIHLAAVIVAYFTALKSSDLMNLKWENIDFDNAKLTVQMQNSGRVACLPLHPVAIQHLQALPKRSETDHVFDGVDFLSLSRRLKTPAGLVRGMHFLRWLAASAVDRVSHGLGAALLCHVGQEVEFPQLREAVSAMPFPAAWKGGAA